MPAELYPIISQFTQFLGDSFQGNRVVIVIAHDIGPTSNGNSAHLNTLPKMLQRARGFDVNRDHGDRDCEKADEAAVMALGECRRTKLGEVTALYFRMDNPPSTEMA